MAHRGYLKDYKLLTDDVLESLIDQRVTITTEGSTLGDIKVLDVSKRKLWVAWPGQNTFGVLLSEIQTLTYVERVIHDYRNPNIDLSQED